MKLSEVLQKVRPLEVSGPTDLEISGVNIDSRKVKPGDSVKAGDTLLILEAMKMENEISAPQDGTVATIDVRKGDVVDSGTLLCTMN